jgi:hypothetical protein
MCILGPVRRRWGTAVVTGLLAFGIAAADAEARTIDEYFQVSALVPMRIHEQIGFVPVGGLAGPLKIRYHGDVYKGLWANTTIGRLTLSQGLKEMRRQARGGNGFAVWQGTYADRRLTAGERRHFEVLSDFARDADVLVVRAGHPACAGLTQAEVRGIASGRVTSWSQVGSISGVSGSIALRHTVVDGAFEPRFGVAKKPRSAAGRRDGGITDAARDPTVAGVTSWSRARFRSGVCAVPIDGTTPTDVSVHDLTYRGAYPVSFVAPRKRPRDSFSATLLRLYVKFLESDKAAKLFRGHGLLMTADTPEPPATGGPQSGGGGPSQDAQGRPITPVRDDAAATSALTGERLEEPGSGIRWAFEPDSVFHLLETSGTCTQSNGTWTLLEGWRYAENGGGIIARIGLQMDATSEHTVELPAATPDVGYVDGRQFTRSRSLPGSC